jgi:hypothetical protein
MNRMTSSIDASLPGAAALGGLEGAAAVLVVASGGTGAGDDDSACPPTDCEQPATRVATAIRPATRTRPG